MRLKMLLDTVGQWWRPENGTVSILDLIMARLLVKLCRGLTYMLSLEEQVTWKTREAVLGIQSRAKATISRRTIEQIKPVEFKWSTNSNQTGFFAQSVGTVLPNTITFNSTPTTPVLTITGDGEVIWNGKPSEAADILVQSFQFKVEQTKGFTKAARRRYYLRACQNILNKAESMERQEFLDFLKKQVYNKERRVIMDGLKGEE
jgi:hypothetical protein